LFKAPEHFIPMRGVLLRGVSPSWGFFHIQAQRYQSVLPARALDFSVIVITILVCSLLIDCWRDSDR